MNKDIDWDKVKEKAKGDANLEYFALPMIKEYHRQLMELLGPVVYSMCDKSAAKMPIVTIDAAGMMWEDMDNETEEEEKTKSQG